MGTNVDIIAGIIALSVNVTKNIEIANKSMLLSKRLSQLLRQEDTLWVAITNILSCVVCFDQVKSAYPHSLLVLQNM